MNSPSDWSNLPALLFCDVMMRVGLESLDDLHQCRQVCSSWNKAILDNIWRSPRQRRKLEAKLEQCWEEGEPKYSKTVKTFDNTVEVRAASGQTVALWDSDNALMRVFHKKTDEWENGRFLVEDLFLHVS